MTSNFKIWHWALTVFLKLLGFHYISTSVMLSSSFMRLMEVMSFSRLYMPSMIPQGVMYYDPSGRYLTSFPGLMCGIHKALLVYDSRRISYVNTKIHLLIFVHHLWPGQNSWGCMLKKSDLVNTALVNFFGLNKTSLGVTQSIQWSAYLIIRLSDICPYIQWMAGQTIKLEGNESLSGYLRNLIVGSV